MKRVCSLNDNYVIVGACDIKEINKKISQFKDNSWTQIAISKKLSIPYNKLPIKTILQINLNIKINSTKIITGPESDSPNIEGLELTGKLLLVSGNILEYIIYNPDKINNPMYSVEFHIPFNTYIVIDENSSSINDSFCVYNCVENVFIEALDERTLIQNIKLFLFAHRIEGLRQKLDNSFIFRTNDSNEEMAKIEFDTDNNTLIVTSTGKPYNNPNVPIAFKFELKDPTESKIKFFGEIAGNDSANNFKKNLKSKSFEIGDVIVLTYNDPTKVELTDYIDIGDTYTMNNSSTEKFLITLDGILPILASNKIIVKSKNDEIVLTIEFLKESGKFIVSSKGVIPDPNSSDYYFILILKDKTGQDIVRSVLNSNEDGTSFKSTTNNTTFVYNECSLTLIYKEKDKIEISNYPVQGTDYTPPLTFNIFNIKSSNLEDIAFKSKIEIINDSNKEMSSLYFFKSLNTISINNISAATIVATSTDAISTNGQPNKKYVQYLQYSQTSPLMYTEILTQSNAENFKNSLDGENIQNNQRNILRLSNRINKKIIITNYNIQNNQSKYMVGEEPEFIDIKSNNLSNHSLNYNKIRLKNNDNTSILFLYFDKLDQDNIYIELYSTGVTNNDSNLFSFKIIDSNDETNVKVQGRINKGETGDVITIGAQPYNISKDFSFGDFLALEYSDGSLVEIFDFPESKNIYNPLKNSQKFEITENGLSVNKFITNFVFKTHDSDEEMAKVEFDSINKRLIVASTGKSYNDPSVSTAFKFELKHSHITPPKISETINGNENADKFKNTLNSNDFEFGDLINITYDDSTKLILNNYLKKGDIYNMTLGSKEAKFLITSIGILPILNPKIIVKSKINNKIVLTIQFIEETKKFLVTSSGIIADNTSTDPYLTFILKDKDGVDVLRTTLFSNENGDSFKSKVHDKSFKPEEYILALIYKEKTSINILDYPTRENIYTPELDFNIFRIRTNNLENTAFNSTIKIINDSDQEMSKLYFTKSVEPDKIAAIVITASTNAISTNKQPLNKKYIEYLEYYLPIYEKYEEILTGDSSLNFSNNLDGHKIEPINLILRFSNRYKDRIIITNYNNEDEYKIEEEPEFIQISDSLRPHPLNYNKIKFKNIDDSVISYIYFDKLGQNNIYIESYSTGIENKSSSKFSFKITDLKEATIKVQGNINTGETGDVIKFGTKSSNISNNFNIGDLLILEYPNGNLVDISDFPNPPMIYNPSRNSKKFMITSNGLSINKFINSFIFKTSDSNKEMGRIEFDSINKRLIVTSTSEPYNNPSVSIAFKFTLKNSDESTSKISMSIGGNENADNFKGTLDDYDFEFGDVIDLAYKDSSKVILNNYPSTGDIYNMDKDLTYEQFVIKPTGIIPMLYPAKIIVKSKNNEEVVTIQFSERKSQFIVSSTGKIPDPSSNDPYLILTLTDSNGTEDLNVILTSNQNGDDFKKALNNKKFKFGDNRLILKYKDENKIEIIDYPKQGERYVPDSKFNFFEITEINLIDRSFNSKIKIYSDDDKEVALIIFAKFNTVKLFAIPTDVIASKSLQNDIVYAQFIQYTNNRISVSAQILGKEDASNFASRLFNMRILESFPIKISARSSQKIIITNYKNQSVYRVGDEPEFFKISGVSLIPYQLFYDKIKFKNMDNSSVLYIYFDKVGDQIYMQTHSTDIVNKDSDTLYFRIPDFDPTQPTVLPKIRGNIEQNKTGDYIKLDQSGSIANISKDIDIDDIIELNYSYCWLIEIYYLSGKKNILTGTSQKFTITKDALVTTKLEKNLIEVSSYNRILTNISFNTTSKTLKVDYNTNIAESSVKYYIQLTIKDKNGTTKYTSSALSDSTAYQFSQALNGKPFEYGDIIDLSYEAYFYKIKIYSYPKNNYSSHPFITRDIFVISELGLNLYIRYLKNIITFTGYSAVFAMLRFNITSKTLDIKGYNFIINWLYGSFEYYSVVLKGSNGTIKKKYSGKGNTTGLQFQNAFDNVRFEYGDSITLRCALSTKIKISNYPAMDSEYYNINNKAIEFRITENGLYLI